MVSKPMLTKECYLIVATNGLDMFVRLTTRTPKLEPNERVIKLKLAIPRALFVTPALLATIEIPASSLTPQELHAEVFDKVTEAMEGVQDVRMDIRIVEPERE